MLHIINIVKGKVPPNANMWLVTLICLFTLVTSLWARLPGAPQWIRNHHAKDNIFSYFTYITAAIFSLMVTLNVGPVFIIDPVVGASSVNVARDVIYSVVIAGALVVFLTEFGLLEFIGTLMEPIMRKCFRVPGKSSIDALSSFVCSPAVEAIAQIMQLPSIQVIQVLDDLSRRGWIYEQEESGHLLLRDRFGLIETLLYERMPRYKRMELHRLALDYYELRRQQSSGDLFYLTQLCRHSSHTYNTQKKVYYHILHLERVLDYFDEFFPTIVDDTIQYNERWLISREETYARFQQYSAELQALEAELPSSQYYELLMKLYFLRSIELYEQFDTYWLRSIAESSLAMIYAAGDSRDRALEHFRKAEVFSQKEMAQEELAVLEQARCVLKEAGIL